MDLFASIGAFFPSRLSSSLDSLMKHSGSGLDGKSALGLLAIFTLLFYLVGFSLLALSPVRAYFYGIGEELFPSYGSFFGMVAYVAVLVFIYVFILASAYSYLSLREEVRRNAIESVIPDFLSLVSSNIRSGMSLEQAMWQAAKPEFGIFSKELKRSIKDAFAGVPIDEALDSFANRFNSPMLSRTVSILKESIKTGGEIAVVLEKTAEEARDVSIARKEIRAQLLVYVIFLIFASTIGVPALLAVSGKMIENLETTFSISTPSEKASDFLGVSFSKPPFSSKEFHWFSIIMIFINIFIASFIVSVAYAGNKRQAFKFFPFMLLASYVIYFVARVAVDAALGGL